MSTNTSDSATEYRLFDMINGILSDAFLTQREKTINIIELLLIDHKLQEGIKSSIDSDSFPDHIVITDLVEPGTITTTVYFKEELIKLFCDASRESMPGVFSPVEPGESSKLSLVRFTDLIYDGLDTCECVPGKPATNFKFEDYKTLTGIAVKCLQCQAPLTSYEQPRVDLSRLTVEYNVFCCRECAIFYGLSNFCNLYDPNSKYNQYVEVRKSGK